MRISDWSSDVCSSDPLVLGCTHYPFLRPVLSELVGPQVRLLDTGEAVARQTQRVLEREDPLADAETSGTLEWRTSSERARVAPVDERLLRVLEERSEERRVGKEWVSKCRSRVSP